MFVRVYMYLYFHEPHKVIRAIFLRAYTYFKRNLLYISQIELAFFLFLVYQRTLLPGVGYSGDTAKFQFIGKVLGTPHETGYPTYILLNHLFINLFPFGELAYKANLLSALISIVSVLVLLRILLLINIDPFIASTVSFSFGVTYTIWSQSIIAEVYTLNLLFVCLVIFFLLKWNISRQDKYFLAACALYSISFGNHLTMITFLPAIIFFVWHTNKKVLCDSKNIISVSIFILLGALQYVYIFWRVNDPHPLYIEMEPHNFREFIWYMRGGNFNHLMFTYSINQIMNTRIPMLIKLLNREFPFMLFLPVIGFITFEKRGIRNFLLLCAFGNIFFSINYDIQDIFVYFIPSYLIITIFLAQGLQWLWIKLSSEVRWLNKAFLLLIPIALLISNYHLVDQSSNHEDADRTLAVLHAVGKDAIIIAPNYDYIEYFWYYLAGQGIQNERNIYLQYHFNVDQIKNYIYQDVPFYIPFQKKNMPIDLAVYVMSSQQRKTLEDQGLSLVRVQNGLFKIVP